MNGGVSVQSHGMRREQYSAATRDLVNGETWVEDGEVSFFFPPCTPRTQPSVLEGGVPGLISRTARGSLIAGSQGRPEVKGWSMRVGRK